MTSIEPLPPRTRLFHVGIPKSGTTSLQMAATARRRELLHQGVLYPGDSVNQRAPVLAFMGRKWGWGKDRTPPSMSHWDELMAEIEADEERRVFFGHEFAAEANDETARRFVDAIGERCHVLITLRNFGAILPSAWQQFVKAGTTVDFDDWLKAVLSRPPDRSVTRRFHRRTHQGRVVRRWVQAAGPDRVTVVVADSRQPQLLTDSVEQLLALEPGTLAPEGLDGFAANRGLTATEAALFLALNRAIARYDVSWDDFERVVRYGAQRRLMELTEGDSTRLMLPEWAAKQAAERGAEFAEQIQRTGARVIGDLSALSEPVPSRPETDEPIHQVPVEMAAEAMAGLLSGGLYRGHDFQQRDSGPTEQEIALREAQIAHKLAQVPVSRMIRVGLGYLRTRLRHAFRRGSARGRDADPRG